MSGTPVSFYSHGHRLAADLFVPEGPGGPPWPAVVQGPGWLGLRDAKLYRPYHVGLLAAGFAVLTFDYRGFGDSEGSATYLDPASQVEDIVSAITYLEGRSDIDARRLGVFGSGGTGGGNAVLAAAFDTRLKAMVAQVPVADGRDWLHRMRREHEWLEFLERLSVDRITRATTGRGELVAPRDGLMVPTPERRVTVVKEDVDGRVPTRVELASAEAIFAYRPIDHVARIAPRASMFICVEGDATTPEDHAFALYEQAGAPKRLILQTDTTHYGAYARYNAVVTPLIVEWFERHLVGGAIRINETSDPRAPSWIDAPTPAGLEIREESR